MRLEFRDAVHTFLNHCEENKINPLVLSKEERDEIMTRKLAG